MTTDEAVVAEGHEGEDDFPFRMLLTFVVSEHFALDEDSSTRLSLSSWSSIVSEACRRRPRNDIRNVRKMSCLFWNTTPRKVNVLPWKFFHRDESRRMHANSLFRVSLFCKHSVFGDKFVCKEDFLDNPRVRVRRDCIKFTWKEWAADKGRKVRKKLTTQQSSQKVLNLERVLKEILMIIKGNSRNLNARQIILF